MLMRQQMLSISNNSLRFSRGLCGGLALLSYLTQNYWILGVIAILMRSCVSSIKSDVVYQVHLWFSEKILKKEIRLEQKDQRELSFVCGMAGTISFVSFLLIYFEKFASLAWTLIVAFSGLLLLSGITGVCVATLFYLLFKKVFKIE